jgi:hypothetical protein
LKDFGKTTRYFRQEVLRKRLYLKPEWIERARKGKFENKEIQPDGRVKVWLYISEEKRYLRVVFLEDGNTVHNAFFDRTYPGRKNR